MATATITTTCEKFESPTADITWFIGTVTPHAQRYENVAERVREFLATSPAPGVYECMPAPESTYTIEVFYDGC